MLLTTTIVRPPGSPPPFGPVGWARLRAALGVEGIEPGDLLSIPLPKLDDSFDTQKILELLRRAAPAAMELDKLADVGIWAMGHMDPDYPSRLSKRLARGAPPVLFGAGDRTLLGQGGLAVVGSRDSAESALEAAASIGQRAAEGGITIISGAARGIDQAAMEGAAQASGRVVGVVADRLDRRIRDKALRDPIAAGLMVLATPYVPSAGFSVRTAMGRNKVIYGLADVAVVISSAAGSGGTWEGATQAIKGGQIPVFVWSGGSPKGRQGLMEAGARPWPLAGETEPITLKAMQSWSSARAPKPQLSLFEPIETVVE